MNVLPSTSVIVTPRASETTTGKVSASGEATLAARRSSTSRVRGPGTGVLSSIVRVVAIDSSVAKVPARLHTCMARFSEKPLVEDRNPGLHLRPGACPQLARVVCPQAWKGSDAELAQ